MVESPRLEAKRRNFISSRTRPFVEFILSVAEGLRVTHCCWDDREAIVGF
jgi:hypothetical protein